MTEHLIPTAGLHRWVVDIFLASGSDEREAKLTADHLVGANLAGHDSHGVGMVPRYVSSWLADELQLNQHVDVEQDSGTMLTINGRRGMGQAVTHEAMDLAIARARQHGVCVMGLKNSHHLGRVGHWAEQAVAQGMVSVHFVNAVSFPIVAPHGGTQARIVTNPFTVGIPVPGREPILLDFATSALAMGKVRVAHNKQVQVPDNSLLDRHGQPTTDPGVIFPPAGTSRGALLPFAGHKGYALAMVCELLGAALIGGETTRPANTTMRFIEAMIAIREEIRQIESGNWPQDNNPLKNAPHTAESLMAAEWNHAYPREVGGALKGRVPGSVKYWPPVGRVDNVYGDRNLFCSCIPLSEYA